MTEIKPKVDKASLDRLFSKCPILEEIYSYWNRVKGSNYIPKLSSFDPVQIPNLLPHLILFNVEKHFSKPRFKTKLVGQKLNLITSPNIENQYMDLIIPSEWTRNWEHKFTQCAEDGEIFFGRSRTFSQNEAISRIDWILLPISTNGTEIDLLMVGLDIIEHDGRDIIFDDNFRTIFERP